MARSTISPTSSTTRWQTGSDDAPSPRQGVARSLARALIVCAVDGPLGLIEFRHAPRCLPPSRSSETKNQVVLS